MFHIWNCCVATMIEEHLFFEHKKLTTIFLSMCFVDFASSKFVFALFTRQDIWGQKIEGKISQDVQQFCVMVAFVKSANINSQHCFYLPFLWRQSRTQQSTFDCKKAIRLLDRSCQSPVKTAIVRWQKRRAGHIWLAFHGRLPKNYSDDGESDWPKFQHKTIQCHLRTFAKNKEK